MARTTPAPTASSTRRRSARRPSPTATPAASASSSRPSSRRPSRELQEISELASRAGNYAMLRFSIDTADPALGALLQRVQEKSTQIETKLIFFELEWAGARRRARRRAPRRRGPGHRAPLPALRAPLPPAPADRARGEDPRREVRHRQLGLVAPVQRADLGDHRRPARPGRAGRARRRARAAHVARPRRAPRDGRGRHGVARPGPAHAGLHLQHAARRQGDRRPPAQLPQLAGGAQPLQRGVRRVRPGAADRRAQPLRHRAPLVSPQGAAARPRRPRRLRPHRRRHAGRRAGRLGGRQGARARVLRRLHARARRPGARVLRRQPHRRPAAAGQARRRLRRLHRPVRAPVPHAQLHRQAPRRADPRPRDGPRPARRARPPARRLRAGHAADARRDGVGVRRDARLQPPARRGGHAGVAAVAAGRVDRGLDRDGLPPDGDEPLRGARPHRAPR